MSRNLVARLSRRRLLIGSGIALVLVGAVALAFVVFPSEDSPAGAAQPENLSTPTSRQSLVATKTILWTAYDVSGERPAPGLSVSGREVAARCTASSTSLRRDSLRCFGAAHHVYDPCWLPANWTAQTSRVLCGFPGRETVTELVLAEPPPAKHVDTPADLMQRNPTMITLADGRSCFHASGAVSSFEGLRESYWCPHEETYDWIYGDVDRSQAVWTVAYLAPRSSTLSRVSIAIAYY
jgi:hypothetical protein